MLSKSLEECQQRMTELIARRAGPAVEQEHAQVVRQMHEELLRAYHLGSQDLLKAITQSLDIH